MATVILRTRVGAAYDKAVRNGTQPRSPITHIVLLDHQPITDIAAIQAITTLTGEVFRITRNGDDDPGFLITEDSDILTRFEVALLGDAAIGCHIRAIAILLENGTVWGYAPYMPQHGGLLKTNAFDIIMDLVVVEMLVDVPLNINWVAMDYRSLRERLLTDLNANIESLYAQLLNRLRSTLANDIDICVIDGGDETGTPCDNTSGTLITLADRVDGGNL